MILVTVGKKHHVEDQDAHIGPSKHQKFTDAPNWAQVQTGDEEEVGPKAPSFRHTYNFIFTSSPPDTDKVYDRDGCL